MVWVGHYRQHCSAIQSHGGLDGQQMIIWGGTSSSYMYNDLTILTPDA
jgi:hypothetical protein